MATLYDCWNPHTLRQTEVVTDADTGLPLIVHVQDTRPILAANQRDAANFDRHKARRADFVHVARIPMPEWIKLQRLGITSDQRAFNAYLNMRETRAFRCDDGRTL